jgi:hypothetical protein
MSSLQAFMRQDFMHQDFVHQDFVHQDFICGRALPRASIASAVGATHQSYPCASNVCSSAIVSPAMPIRSSVKPVLS